MKSSPKYFFFFFLMNDFMNKDRQIGIGQWREKKKKRLPLIYVMNVSVPKEPSENLSVQ